MRKEGCFWSPFPLGSSTLFPRLQPSPHQEQRLLFFFFLMEEVKSSVYLAKKNPWNSSWPFLKYNKEAGLLTTGRAALTCRQSSSTSAWGGEEAPESTRKAAPSSRGKGSDSRTWFFPGAGSTEHGSCVRQMHQPLSPPWLEACENCDVLWTR